MIIAMLIIGFIGVVTLFVLSPKENKVLPEIALFLALFGLVWGNMAASEAGHKEGYNQALEDAGIEMVITEDTTYTITKDTTWVKK